MAEESKNSACPPDIFFDVRDLSSRSAPGGRAIPASGAGESGGGGNSAGLEPLARLARP